MAWNQDFGEGANPGSGFAQQSWRDSFNGGKAAGDWTGNHNARLEAERAAFGGATWSGSSTQPSALQLAQSMVGTGPGRGGVASGTGSSGTGPGNPVVSNGPAVQTQGPGRRVVVTGQPDIPVFVPGFGPKKKVHDGDFRYLDVGFGLTWASPADYAKGQDIEDEMGEWGALPFQIHKFATEAGINAGRFGSWGIGAGMEAIGPYTSGALSWLTNTEGATGNIDRDRVNPFGVAVSPF